MNFQCYVLFMYFVLYCISNITSEAPKTSLVFVIDKTKSMKRVIDKVFKHAESIFDTATSYGSSSIENFVLVYFGDPNVSNANVTANSKEFREALSLESLEYGQDCPEKALTGVQTAVRASLDGCLVYVFTDASAKDYSEFHSVKRMVQKKNCQIHFILSGRCEEDSTEPERRNVYYKLADATFGQVFHMMATDIDSILEYVKDSIEAPKVVLNSTKFLPDPFNHTLTFEVDPKLDDVTIAIAEESMSKTSSYTRVSKPAVYGPDGVLVDDVFLYELVSAEQVMILKIEDPETGMYKVSFLNNKTSSHVVVSARSEVTFRHGFSLKIDPFMNDTTVFPIPGANNYLHIRLYGDNVRLTSAFLLNNNYRILKMLPLTIQNSAEKIYVTKHFRPPYVAFRIAVGGIDNETGMNITRFSRLILETERFVNQRPVVQIKSEGTEILDYGSKLTLNCTVVAYPAPKIIWKDLLEDRKLESVFVAQPPYNYSSVLNLVHVIKNATYACRAENTLGFHNKTITIMVKSKPYFIIQEKPVSQELKFNEKAILRCKVNSYPESKIHWNLPSKSLQLLNNIEISADNSTLIVKNMKQWCVGRYYCLIEYLDKKYSRYATLALSSKKPVIEKEPFFFVSHINVGDTAILTCRILQGNPIPEIQWYFKYTLDLSANFIEIEEGRNVTTITLERRNIRDTGIYKCRATNIMGTDQRYFELFVEGKPTIINGHYEHRAVELNNTVDLNCTVEGVPIPEVNWYKDGIPVAEDGYTVRLFSDRLRLSHLAKVNSGEYTCEAKNKFGSVNKTTNLTVYYLDIEPPENNNITVREKKYLYLECEASGFPEPILYTWKFYTKNKSNVLSEESTDGSFYLSKVYKKNEGYYTCEAYNSLSSKNISFYVEVLYAPKFHKQKRRYRAVVGDYSLRIYCNVSGNPKPKIKWWISSGYTINDNLPVAKVNGYNFEENWFIINNVTSKAQDKYSCEAQNDLGKKFGTEIEVIVKNSPLPGDIKHNTDIKLHVGAKSRIKCELRYKRTDRLAWYKDEKLINFGELVINGVKKSDAGVYICRVTKVNNTNSIETASVTVEVESFLDNKVINKEVDLGEEVVLYCDTSGFPDPTVTWTHNGKKLKLINNKEHNFKMNSEALETFVCYIHSAFGNATHTFNVDYKDCVLVIDSNVKEQALMITTYDNYTWPSFKQKGKFTIIPKNEVVHFICPSKFTYIDKTDITAKCIGGNKFQTEDIILNYSNITCQKIIRPKLIGSTRTSKICLGNGTLTQQLVFDLGHKTKEAFEYCVDKHRNTIFVKYTIWYTSNILPKDQSMWDKTSLDIYNCDEQRHRFKEVFSIRKCCFDKLFLVNARDLFPGPWQRASYNRLNVVPIWSTCHSENWVKLEEKVRLLSKTKDRLIIYTGIAGYWTKIHRRADLIMSINRKQIIPTYLWKVIQDPSSRSSIAVIRINIPDISRLDIEMEHVLCRDICRELPWLDEPTWKDETKGYIYCCSLQDFMIAFHEQNFDRDFLDYAVFYPYYDILK